FEFHLTAMLRRPERPRRGAPPRWHLHQWIEPGEELPEEFLRFGVQFADERAATNLGNRPFPLPQADPDHPLLVPNSGGGDDQRYDQQFWVWPLPPPGPLTFVCEWPAFGIPETREEIDAQLVLDAATRSIELWPAED